MGHESSRWERGAVGAEGTILVTYPRPHIPLRGYLPSAPGAASLTPKDLMRSRERILANLEQIYRESYDKARAAGSETRMGDLDNAFMRDQLMLEILLDIRDLFAVAPAAPDAGASALQKLETLRRIARR